MSPEQLSQQHDPMPCRDIRKSYESRVADTVQIDEIPEVLVQSQHDAAFHPGPFEQRTVPGVGADLPRIENVVPLLAQP